MPKRPVRYEKQKKARERALKERKALSYEDVPLEQYDQEEIKLKRPPKKVIRLLLILVLCSLAVILWANRESLSPQRVGNWFQNTLLGMGVGSGYPTPISGSEVQEGNFQLLDYQDAVVVSDTSFTLYNDSAKELAQRQHSFSSPVLRTDGSLAVVYHQEGTGIRIESASETLTSRNLEQKIISASVSSSGVYAALTQSKNYLGELTVYLSDDTEKYKYYFSEWYPVDISLSADGTWGAVTGIAAQDGTVKSVVYIFDFNQEEPKAKFEFSDNLLLSIRCLESGNVAAIGNRGASIMIPAAQEKIDYDYQGKTLSTFQLDPYYGMVLALAQSEDGRNCTVVRIDNQGKTAMEYPVARKVTSIGYNNGVAGIVSSGRIYTYSDLGEETGAYDAGNDAKKILLYSNSQAYVLGVSEIRQVFFS